MKKLIISNKNFHFLFENIQIDDSKYFKPTTDTTYYDQFLTKPEYMFWVKGLLGTVEYLTPTKYFLNCAEAQDTSITEQYTYINHTVAEEYKKNMMDGEKFPMPFVDFYSKQQEGRHRTFAVQLINPYTKIPVLIVEDFLIIKNDYVKKIQDKISNGANYSDIEQFLKKQSIDIPFNEIYFDKIKNDIL